MGKVSDEDFRGMAGRLRVRATGLMRQLDAGAGEEARLERRLRVRHDGLDDERAGVGAQRRPHVGDRPATHRAVRADGLELARAADLELA